MATLTHKQRDALKAVAEQQKTGFSLTWWAWARSRWQGSRKTLGSLLARGLVDYDDGWTITEKGKEALNV